jgi:hypothetical protein
LSRNQLRHLLTFGNDMSVFCAINTSGVLVDGKSAMIRRAGMLCDVYYLIVGGEI